MMTLHTKACIHLKVLQALSAIAEAQRTWSRCDIHVVVERNSLRAMVIHGDAGGPQTIGASPFAVAPAGSPNQDD